MDESEIALFRSYLQPKTFHEIQLEAEDIKGLTFVAMNAEEEQELYRDVTDYVEANLDQHYYDFVKPVLSTPINPTFDLIHVVLLSTIIDG